MNPTDLRYSQEHEWVRTEGDDLVVIGITEFASDELGDIVFLELPESGTALIQFEQMGEIESVKAVSEIFSPVSGRVVARNESAMESPEMGNDSPYGDGWLLKARLSDPSELDILMTAEQYHRFVESQDH